MDVAIATQRHDKRLSAASYQETPREDIGDFVCAVVYCKVRELAIAL
jgi:hypothetical protein